MHEFSFNVWAHDATDESVPRYVVITWGNNAHDARCRLEINYDMSRVFFSLKSHNDKNCDPSHHVRTTHGVNAG